MLAADASKILQDSCVVGAALRVVQGGVVTESVDFGLHDSSAGAPVDRDTLFHWASITKILTGVCLLQLRDAGALALEDPVTRYLPELRAAHNPYGSMDDITLTHLATHSAGFRAASWPWAGEDGTRQPWHPFEPPTWAHIVAMLPYTAVQFPPGTVSKYSNLGILFLGRVIEVVTGEPYEAVVHKRVLVPLGMTRAYFDRTPPTWRHHRSASYVVERSDSDRYAIVRTLPFDPSTGVTVSNGGLNATADDLARLVAWLAGAGGPGAATVLSPASLSDVLTYRLPVDGAQTEGGVQGMGLFLFRERHCGCTLWGHAGDQNGFTAHVYFQPNSGAGYVLVMNSVGAGSEAEVDGAVRAAACARLFVGD